MAHFVVELGPSADQNDADLVAAELIDIPDRLKKRLDDKRIKVAVCRDNVMNFDPDEFSRPPEGWPDGMGWDDVPGAYIPNTRKVVVATIGGEGQPRRVPRRGEKHGSFSLAVHELVHGLDEAMNTVSNSGAFRDAWEADADTLAREDVSSYYLRKGTGRRESFAEGGARRFGLQTGGAPHWDAIQGYWDAILSGERRFAMQRAIGGGDRHGVGDHIGFGQETETGSLILFLHAISRSGASGHARIVIDAGDPRLNSARRSLDLLNRRGVADRRREFIVRPVAR